MFNEPNMKIIMPVIFGTYIITDHICRFFMNTLGQEEKRFSFLIAQQDFTMTKYL